MAVKHWLQTNLSFVIEGLGAAAVLGGAWMVWPPLVFIAGGGVLLVVGYLVAREKRQGER